MDAPLVERPEEFMDWGLWATGLVGLILATGLVIKIWGALLPDRFTFSETLILNRFNHEIKVFLSSPEIILAWFPVRTWARQALTNVEIETDQSAINAFYGDHCLRFVAESAMAGAPISLKMRTTLAIGTYPVGFSLQIRTSKGQEGMIINLEEEILVKEVNIRFGFSRILLPELKAGFNHMAETWRTL